MYHLSLYLLLKIIFFSTVSFSQENNTQEKLVANYASFIMYHRFGDSRYPSTNIKKKQFLQHIDELLKPKYNVISIDKAIQAHGAMGLSQDTPLARMAAGARTLRIADGPDEVHLRSIARREINKHS